MKVAILDDTKSDAQILLKYIEKFQVERNDTIQADIYEASFDFLEEYNSQHDVIFLDIEMPGSDGLQVDHEIRKKDQAVGILLSFFRKAGKGNPVFKKKGTAPNFAEQ